jgi:hypothetical protein
MTAAQNGAGDRLTARAAETTMSKAIKDAAKSVNLDQW